MSPRELASHEVQMRQVWNMRQRPALMYVVPDMDGGDDASTLRTALEKGRRLRRRLPQVLVDVSHLRSARRSKRETLEAQAQESPIARPRPCLCAGQARP